MKSRMRTHIIMIFSLCLAQATFGDSYPDMLGTWSGQIRVVSSGESLNDQVATGGAVISEMALKLTIHHQDGATFIGKVRSSLTPKSQPSNAIWGAVRSNGKEALFVTSAGGRGNLWFGKSNSFEFCITTLDEKTISAYCGVMVKE